VKTGVAEVVRIGPKPLQGSCEVVLQLGAFRQPSNKGHLPAAANGLTATVQDILLTSEQCPAHKLDPDHAGVRPAIGIITFLVGVQPMEWFMFTGSQSLAGLVALATLSLIAAPAIAADLTGMWVTNPDNCNKVFVKKGNEMSFAEDSDIYGGGFIVEGNVIRGKIARCTIKSRKSDGNALHLLTTCSTDVMLSNNPFDVVFKDDNTLSRVFHGDSDMSETYYRCKP